jgi:hypothetical protein
MTARRTRFGLMTLVAVAAAAAFWLPRDHLRHALAPYPAGRRKVRLPPRS